jgi:hypothetical protein
MNATQEGMDVDKEVQPQIAQDVVMSNQDDDDENAKEV